MPISITEVREERKRKRRKQRIIMGTAIGAAVVALIVVLAVMARVIFRPGQGGTGGEETRPGQGAAVTEPADGRTAEEVLTAYMDCLAAGDYAGMYELLDQESKNARGKNEFIERNRNIYEGIEAENIDTRIQREASVEVEGEKGNSYKVESTKVVRRTFSYTQTMDSLAGPVSLDNEATLNLEGENWRLSWKDSLIFPDLTEGGRVRVTNTPAERGQIFDRNGVLLAGTGTATSVGLVRGRMAEDSVTRLAEVLGTTVESIEQKMSAGWVTDDVFVPIRTVEKLTEEEVSSHDPTASIRVKKERDEKLRAIPGVLLNDVQLRIYPLGEAAAHLVGYVQDITAEELDADTEGFYNSSSQIGKVGLEALYEERLRGIPGRRIRIQAENGDTVRVLASSNPVQGEDIRLTIDSELQRVIYRVYRADPGAHVAMNPKTGEVLALVSTPSYDTNLFITGISQAQWDLWTNDLFTPLTNRVRAAWTPGSSFKSVVAAIGLTNGSIEGGETYSTSDAWQADDSWGNYYVTTLHTAYPGTVEDALEVSDNVWFARAAVRMGAEALEEGLNALGFGDRVEFPIQMHASTYSNNGHIEEGIQLADSGYGQGEILVNPLHLAVIYSGFMNQGSLILPRLELSEDAEPAFWKENVFSEDACRRIVRALIRAVESGTGTGAQVDGLEIAGKTGTAEIKASQSDESGTELGWFAAFTPELDAENSLLLVSMVEDVKNLGGSGYVTKKSGAIFSWYCMGSPLAGIEAGLPSRTDAGGMVNGQDLGLQWDEDIDWQELGLLNEEGPDWQEQGLLEEDEDLDRQERELLDEDDDEDDRQNDPGNDVDWDGEDLDEEDAGDQDWEIFDEEDIDWQELEMLDEEDP